MSLRLLQKFRSAALGASVAGLMLASTPSTALADAEPYVGDIMLVGFNFCPRNWTEADGKLLPISQNDALFSLYGTFYGGDGRTTFGVPDLRGRRPVHVGSGPGLAPRTQGQKGGSQTSTMTVANLPSHNHFVNVTNETGNKKGPGNDYLAASQLQEDAVYHDGPPNRIMEEDVISQTGGGQTLFTESPYLAGKWCVALFGVYPSRS